MQSDGGLRDFTANSANYAPVLTDEKGDERLGSRKGPPSSQALDKIQPEENTPLGGPEAEAYSRLAGALGAQESLAFLQTTGGR